MLGVSVQRLSAAELGYGYRTSRLKRQELGLVGVVRAAFRVRAHRPRRSGPGSIELRAATHREPAASAQRRECVCQPDRATTPGA